MNLLLIGIVVCLAGLYLAISIGRGYDLVETLGFFGHLFPLSLGAVVAIGAVLYGLTFLIGSPPPRGSGKGKDEDHSSDIANLVP